MWIEIDDAVWTAFKKSWAMLGVSEHEKLVFMLETQLWEESMSILNDTEKQSLDVPEAWVRDEIWIKKTNSADRFSSHGSNDHGEV
jgi:hypothetical protein